MDAEEPRKAAWIGSKEFARMLEDNRTAVEAANRETLKWTSFVTAVILTILFAASFIMRRQFIVPTYAVFAASSAAVYCFTRALGSKWESTFSILPVFYGYMYSLFALALCLAFYVKPGGTISTFIMLTIAFPLIVIDRPRTLIISFLLMDAVFGAYALKGYPASGAINSLVNCAVFSVGGLCLGRYICEIRLKAIEAQRQLSIQSRYDSLTGLGNRRRLFELLKSLESGKRHHDARHRQFQVVQRHLRPPEGRRLPPAARRRHGEIRPGERA